VRSKYGTDKLLTLVLEKKASDLHLDVVVVGLRINGLLVRRIIFVFTAGCPDYL